MHHREQHLANVFGLARFGSEHIEAADFGDTFDETSSFFAETFLYARNGKLGVFNDIVKERGGESCGVHAHVSKDVRDLEKVRHVRVAGAAKLVAVTLRGDFVSATDYPGIFGGTILAKFREQFFQTSVQLALGALAVKMQGKITGTRHLTSLRLQRENGESLRPVLLNRGAHVQSAVKERIAALRKEKGRLAAPFFQKIGTRVRVPVRKLPVAAAMRASA